MIQNSLEGMQTTDAGGVWLTWVIFWIKAIILGIVEGITEFLPISSTGHLIVAADLLNFPEKFGEMFEIVIQLGAILAVVYYYRKRIGASLYALKPGQWGFSLWKYVLIAFAPSVVLGLLFHKAIKELFTPEVVGWSIIIGAILLWIVTRIPRGVVKEDCFENMKFKDALVIGLCQTLAMIPGMSRSGSTIMGGLLMGYSAKAAAEFSFFLAIPTMFAATAFELIKGASGMTGQEWVALILGFVVSFIVAFLVVGKFLDYLGKKSLDVFVYYRLIAGIVILAYIYA